MTTTPKEASEPRDQTPEEDEQEEQRAGDWRSAREEAAIDRQWCRANRLD